MTRYDESGRILNLEELLGDGFTEIENPARYIGSEYIYGKKRYEKGNVRGCMCFPDLYEIGMANNAVRILYDIMNRNANAVCDRVFAVAPDFEKLLREKGIPLFTLEEHFPLKKMDYLGISIGYELCATNILQVLDLGGIPISAKDRTDDDPIVFAGGPAATNPLPFAEFFDFVYIGEAETDLNRIIDILGTYRTRKERLQALREIPCLWYPGKKMARRAVDLTFGTQNEEPELRHFAVSSFETAQDHGTVEIMR
ncbi:MAG: B12-binding domain-containing radical SAM protein, partial [Spirochaetales bacterium]|nr:B12-binding domain-containing radical SAM protein [Spirochaetales bacterium]